MKLEMKRGWFMQKTGCICFCIGDAPPDAGHYRWIVIMHDGTIFRVNDKGEYHLGGSYSGLDIIEHLPECTGWNWQPVVRSATPQPGEWWRRKDGQAIYRIVGTDFDGSVVYEMQGRELHKSPDWSKCQHEPTCTGWNWSPKQ